MSAWLAAGHIPTTAVIRNVLDNQYGGSMVRSVTKSRGFLLWRLFIILKGHSEWFGVMQPKSNKEKTHVPEGSCVCDVAAIVVIPPRLL